MNENTRYIAEAVAEYLVKPSQSHPLDEVLACDTLECANARLRHLTGVRRFFPDHQAFDDFRYALSLPTSGPNDRKEREWGDYQTPPSLAARVCDFLAKSGVSPQIIIEPTYGTGNFILGALKSFPKAKLVYGVEIQNKYEWNLKMTLLTQALYGHRPPAEIELRKDNIFTHTFPDDILGAHGILIVGNPPWVTSAELGALDARNVPAKRNLKGFTGLDAVTGKSNFDVGEFILLRLLELFAGRRGTLAMLCKNSVIKNIVEALPRSRFTVANIRAYAINAKEEFGASVDASLLLMDMGVSTPSLECQVAAFDNPGQPTRVFGWSGNKFVSDARHYEAVAEIDGHSPLVWRQGLKHDCSRIMELDDIDGVCVNGNGEVIDVEESRVYWLLKSSDLRKFEVDRPRKKVIVTQRYIGDDTARIQVDAPKLWQYLVRNQQWFERRKSSIYRNKPHFSIFGIGEYSFRLYKVAISGLYKQPRFALVLPVDDRPVMLDDTCYFLGFDTYREGLFTATVLNSPMVKQLLQSITFTDAKRPFTKEVLMRIDLYAVARRLSFDALRAVWASVNYELKTPVAEPDFEEYLQNLSNNLIRQSDNSSSEVLHVH